MEDLEENFPDAVEDDFELCQEQNMTLSMDELFIVTHSEEKMLKRLKN